MSNDTRLFDRINGKKASLDALLMLTTRSVAKLRDTLAVEWTYNSNAIEGNTLTLRETFIATLAGRHCVCAPAPTRYVHAGRE